MKEKLENTEILSRFDDYELTLTAIRSSQKMGGKEPNFVTLFLPEYINGQAIDLLSPVLERSCLCV